MYKLSKREFESMFAADCDRRFEYFFEKISETGKIWTLRSADGSGIISLDCCCEENGEFQEIPVWCYKRFAEDFVKNSEGFDPAEDKAVCLSLADFLKEVENQPNLMKLEFVMPIGDRDDFENAYGAIGLKGFKDLAGLAS